jgi:folate-binding protein YgfZ
MATVHASRLAEDYEQITHGCGLLDRSERGKLALTGTDTPEFLNGQLTNDVVALREGDGCYAAFLTHKGKMLGDVRVLRTRGADGELEMALDTERVALQALFDLIRRFKVGHAVELHKRTLQRGLLSLVGPAARRVAGAAARTHDPHEPGDATHVLTLALEEHANIPAQIAGTQVLLVSTDVGVDVLCESEATTAVAQSLSEAGARPVLEPAVEALRVEHGRPRYGIDLDDATIPQEAGLNERAVSFTKGCYVGQENTARMNYRAKVNRRLVVVPASGPSERTRAFYPDLGLAVEHRRVEDLGAAIVPDWLAKAL